MDERKYQDMRRATTLPLRHAEAFRDEFSRRNGIEAEAIEAHKNTWSLHKRQRIEIQGSRIVDDAVNRRRLRLGL